MITALSIILILISLSIVAVQWSRHGWNQSYWIVFGCTVFVAILLLIGEFV